jgi:hypothetical protein
LPTARPTASRPSPTPRCAPFSRDRLWPLFHAQPKLGYDITWLAAREEKMVDDNLVTAGRRNAGERVAMLLMHLYRRAERVGMVRDGWVEFPFNQQHIADALGLSLVHTNKTLAAAAAPGALQDRRRLAAHPGAARAGNAGRLLRAPDAPHAADLKPKPERPAAQRVATSWRRSFW